MVKVKGKIKEELLKLVREEFPKTYSASAVKHLVDEKLGVDLSVNTIKYWIKIVFKGEYLEKLKTENEIMAKWKKKTEAKTETEIREDYAENLDLLFSGEIAQEEFKPRFEAENGKNEANE